MTDPYGWRVRIVDEFGHVDLQRVIIYRHVGDQNEVIRPTPTGAIEAKRYDPAVVADEPMGFLLPRGALDAIAEAIKPGPSQGEVARLEEALTVERARVDALLTRAGIPAPS